MDDLVKAHWRTGALALEWPAIFKETQNILPLSRSHHSLALLLGDLQTAMKSCGIWSAEVPSLEALSSTQPFCVDTLSFELWLQFVMMARFKEIVSHTLPLPKQCDITSMAEEAFKGRSLSRVIVLISAIDKLINNNPEKQDNKLTHDV